MKKLNCESYLAPELYKGNWNFKSDIWSVGVLMYHLLTGSLPLRPDETNKQNAHK
jgi:serine/threonine protein kinase